MTADKFRYTQANQTSDSRENSTLQPLARSAATVYEGLKHSDKLLWTSYHNLSTSTL
jgi:hypothetical protein